MSFDWPDATSVMQSVGEEIEELREVLECVDDDGDDLRVEEELGDLLLAMANLARHLQLSPEVALRRANAKFERRFRQLERDVERGQAGSDRDALEARWEWLKQQDRG